MGIIKYSEGVLSITLKILTLSILFLQLSCELSFSQELTKDDTSNVRFLNSRKFYIYKVSKGETLFSISQKFKIPQEEIIQFNREIGKNGLKNKMKIWIPAWSWLKKDSLPENKKVEENKPDKKIYDIAVITSLNLPKIYTSIDTSGFAVDEPLRKDIRENLEFVEGILYAADQMKKEGLKVHLYIIDAESDSLKLSLRLKKNIDYNLIITNESGNVLKYISNFSKSKEIKLLSCGLNTVDIILDNNNAFSMIPSSEKQCEQMGKFSGKYFPGANLVSIKTNATKEKERLEAFYSGWKANQNSGYKQIEFMKGGTNNISDLIVRQKSNLIFIPSSNEDMVSDLLSNISLKIPEYEISVVGLPTWQYFETIDKNTIEKSNVYLFSSGMIDYSSPVVLEFRKFFREKYNVEPGETSYQGYDAFLFAGKSFIKYGRKLFDENNAIIVKGIFSEYDFVRTGPGQAFENREIHVFQPAKDIAHDIYESSKSK